MYTFCPFDNITQNDINNPKNRFVLGLWGSWIAKADENEENEEIENNNKDQDKNVETYHQIYNDGCQCGNVLRQTIVNVICGADDFIIGNLSEPNTCDYRMNFYVPISCLAFSTIPSSSSSSSSNKVGRINKTLQKVAGSINSWRKKIFKSGAKSRQELEDEIDTLKAEIKELNKKGKSRK
mmetsp:Transcript_35621/g.45923  ORF Transcript_35621/g.45923 Transcript_35621/m.45923 type:complete len:181 (+) Transcript_35621:45-587(+)